MYTPRVFAEPDRERLLALIEQHPFGLLIVADGQPGLELSHLPFLLDRGRGGEPDRLRVHVARSNPVWRRALGAAHAVTAVFSGPDAYVSPRWYEQPREQVPTWNYAVVHAHGRAQGPASREELRGLLERLAAQHESGAGADAWTLATLEPRLREELLEQIVGFTVTIERLEGKYKLSQNRSAADHAGVIRGLTARGSPADLEMAALMRRDCREG